MNGNCLIGVKTMNQTLPDFEILLRLAKQDPQALERLRQEHVNTAIESAPEAYRQRLAGLQFQIDGVRRTTKSPMASCIGISKMMHESLNSLKSFIDSNETPADMIPMEAAKVLAFPR
jgi:hypothetical protein